MAVGWRLLNPSSVVEAIGQQGGLFVDSTDDDSDIGTMTTFVAYDRQLNTMACVDQKACCNCQCDKM